MNKTLADLQDRLVRLHKQLREQLKSTDDAAQRQALVTEMIEVTHRVQIVGGLLFAQESEELEAKVADVAKATRKVKDAIAEIKKLKDFLDTITAFLGLVDEALDLAKVL